jgi:hypothetical protein
VRGHDQVDGLVLLLLLDLRGVRLTPLVCQSGM